MIAKIKNLIAKIKNLITQKWFNNSESVGNWVMRFAWRYYAIFAAGACLGESDCLADGFAGRTSSTFGSLNQSNLL